MGSIVSHSTVNFYISKTKTESLYSTVSLDNIIAMSIFLAENQCIQDSDRIN